MSKLDSFIESDVKNCLGNHFISNKKNIELKDSNLKLFINIKNNFQKLFGELIENISLLPECSTEESDESPASQVVSKVPTFEDGSYIYKHNTGNMWTFTLEEQLSSNFEISIKMIKITIGCMSCGVSKTSMKENRGYLGGDMGDGNWGLASNGSLGENGRWNNGKAYKTGDILTIKGNNGVISYRVNEEENHYEFDMGTPDLYLAFTFVYDDEIEIIS